MLYKDSKKDKRYMLLSLLHDYNPKDCLEQEHKKKMISFCINNNDCFKRSCKKGHFTASAWVVNSKESEVLLIHHRKLGLWLQLGGHADGESNLLSVAIKEVLEESGLTSVEPITSSIFDLDIHKIPKYGKEDEHYHFDVRFLLKSSKNDVLAKNEESIEVKWFPIDKKFLPTRNTDILRMFNKWMALSN